METLRFAPIIRVSTERQEKQGESLLTQENQIKDYVKSLNGTIPDYCWQYKGQEHATPGQERKRLEKLLADSSKRIFDAVIVCDASRWSRDNLKSKEGLKILRDNGIRFFVGTMEYDLYNPEHSFYLGISAEIGELQAHQQSDKSIRNRINKAKRGIPTCGAKPYGRTFDKKTEKWGIDDNKKKIIEQAAERYLQGESLKSIASSFNMDFTNLWDILSQRSGIDWPCHFKYGNIDEMVIMTIPRLLEDDVISAIHQKGIAKKTYDHGEIKNKYLLSRMIFCSKCGKGYFGFTNRSGRQYYRHLQHSKIPCKPHKFVPAIELENSILIALVKTLGDVERVKNAIKQATPDLTKVDQLSDEKEQLINQLNKIAVRKEKIIDKIGEGLISDDDVKKNMTKLKDREASINNRLTTIESELTNIPTPERIKSLTTLGIAILKIATKHNPIYFLKKPFEYKHNLLQHAFGGTDSKGTRLGVYIEDTDKGWNFQIHGALETTLLSLPLSREYLIETFAIDEKSPEEEDIEINKIRADITNLAQPGQLRYLLHSNWAGAESLQKFQMSTR
jgi:site-specific DNA recombinase